MLYYRSILLFIVIAVICIFTSMASWVEMEAGLTDKYTENYIGGEVKYGEEADKQAHHSVTFHLIWKNPDQLAKHLEETSNPKHPNYGKHLTKEQVHDMTADVEGLTKIEQYIQDLNSQLPAEGLGEMRITKKTDSSVSVEAPVGAFEKAFHTTFYTVQHTHRDGKTETLNRAKQYHLPEELSEHVRMVTGTVQMPVQLSRGPVKIGLNRHHT